MRSYYAIVDADFDPDELAEEPIDVGDRVVEGYLPAFESVDALLASDRLVAACFGWRADAEPAIARVEADPAEALAPDPEEYEGILVRPIAFVSQDPLRAWLDRIAREPQWAKAAAALIPRLGAAAEVEEDEFADDPYEPDPEAVECWTIARIDGKAERSRPRVDRRDLPSDFRRVYWTEEALLLGELAREACASGIDRFEVRRVRGDEDEVVVPDEPDPDDPGAVFVRPRAIVEATPLREWLASMRARDPERVEELLAIG